METYDVVLFLHILTLLCALGLGSILHAAEWGQRRATTIQELRTITRPYAWGKLFPVFIILLFAFGAWLLQLSDDRFDFGVAWVWTAVIALAILMVSGGAVLGRHAAHYGKLLAATPDGPITPEARAAAFDTTAWTVSHMNTALAVSVVFNMVSKPGTAGAITVLVVGMAIGGTVGLLGARGRAVATA
jgi:hypothetical protein